MLMAMVTEIEGMQKSRQGGNDGRGNNSNCSPTIDTVYSINSNCFFFLCLSIDILYSKYKVVLCILRCSQLIKTKMWANLGASCPPWTKEGDLSSCIRSRGKKIDKGQEHRAGQSEQKR